jgi:hypothetical protein
VSVHSRMQRLFRVSDAALRRGLTMGSLAGVYVGVQALLAVHRGRRSYLPDSFCGGAAVASVYAGGALRRAVLLCCSVDRGFCCGAHSGGHLPVSSAPLRPPPGPYHLRPPLPAGYRAVNATQWPPARLPKDLMIIVGMGLVFGLLDQQYQRELAAEAAAEAGGRLAAQPKLSAAAAGRPASPSASRLSGRCVLVAFEAS